MPAKWYIKGTGVVEANPDVSYGLVLGRGAKTAKHAFIWPHGGQRRGTWGRLADILTNKGPDVFIGTNFNRTPSAIDGPSRGRWTGRLQQVDDPHTAKLDANNHLGDLPFAGSRSSSKVYDFRSRKYKDPYVGSWTNAIYEPGACDQIPMRVFTYPGNQDVCIHPLGDTYLADARNFGDHYVAGFKGQGGYWHPATCRDHYWDEDVLFDKAEEGPFHDMDFTKPAHTMQPTTPAYNTDFTSPAYKKEFTSPAYHTDCAETASNIDSARATCNTSSIRTAYNMDSTRATCNTDSIRTAYNADSSRPTYYKSYSAIDPESDWEFGR